jgi:hypothetical protein
MASFNHDPVYHENTHPYLHNPLTGGDRFYHVTKGEKCAFGEPRLSFFGLTKGFVQEFFAIHPTYSDHSVHPEDDRFTICEVRFRNIKWDNIFDIARYIESVDYDTYNHELGDESNDGMYRNYSWSDMHPIDLTPRGEEIRDRTGFPIEGYYFGYFKDYFHDKGRQLIADLNNLGYGPFYGFLEDEYTAKQPPCDEDDYDCRGSLYGSERTTMSESPLTLALDFRLGRDIVVELVRYEVVDVRGRTIYAEKYDDTFGDDNGPIEFYPGRENPSAEQLKTLYLRSNGEIVHTYKLWRGVPYSGLDLDDLEGRGGYGHQMLGGGLYTTDDYYVAKGYAQPERGRYRDPEREDKPCVYELELAIPEDQIFHLNAYSMSFCRAEGSSAIPHIFGVQSPAFEMTIKDRNTGKEVVYLISENQDPLEYATDFKLECANEVLEFYGLGTMGNYVDFDQYLEDEFYNCEDDDYENDRHKEVCEAFLAYVDEHAGGDVNRAIDSIQNLIDEKIREECGLPNYGKYDEVPNIVWGGDSTDLAELANTHGYKVLWCSEWVASGDEIVIVDDSIYDNGLTIVDDCT